MADCRHLEKLRYLNSGLIMTATVEVYHLQKAKHSNISTTDLTILMKFGMLMHLSLPGMYHHQSANKISRFLKSKMAGSCHLENQKI